jgi:hypothetical protein
LHAYRYPRGPLHGHPAHRPEDRGTEIHVYRLKGGKAVEHRVGRDDLGAMRQLGIVADAVPAPGPAPHAAVANATE